MNSLSGWALLKAAGMLLRFAFLKVSICALLRSTISNGDLRVLFVRFFLWNVLKLNVFAPRICFQIYVLILDQFKTGTELIILFL